jgi:hypothetical protein
MLISALVLACLAQDSTPSAPQAPQAGAPVPLPRRALPADTAFVLHFDARTFLASSWWQALGDMPEVVQALQSSEELRMVREQFGVDPFTDLLSVTVLGRDDKGDGAAVLVRTTDKADGVLEMLRGVDVHGSVEASGLALDRWGEDGGDGVFGSFFATPNGDRVAVLARTPNDVVRVVQAADGEAPRLAEAARPAIDATPRAGAFCYVEVGLPFGELLANTPAAFVANGVERLTIELGEHDGKIFIELKARAKDRNVARRIADVVNGARALVANFGVMEQMPFAVQDLYNGLIAEVQGNDVRIGLDIPARDLVYMLGELQSELR